ncbi:hypothetical protein [Paraburkholderia youngii]|uniref:hypothetical protein n=1 Tax=Paraburkholderia youngii TaxID=2782701 RepID=UPI003D209C20
MSKKPLRERMPGVAAQIDALRLRHGNDPMHDRIRRAQAGEPAFYALEGEHTFGVVPASLASWAESIDQAFDGDFSLIAYETGPDLPGEIDPEALGRATARARPDFCPGCNGSCVGTPLRCSEHRARQTRAPRGGRPNELWITGAVPVPAEPEPSGQDMAELEFLDAGS